MNYLPLDEDQRNFFETKGYLVVKNVLDEKTLDSLIRAGDRLIESSDTRGRQINGPGYHGFGNCIALDDAFLPLLAHAKTFSYVVQLLSPNIHLSRSHLIYKYPDPPEASGNRRIPGWHRDITNTPEDLGHAAIPKMDVKVAYYLTDLSNPNCGVTLFAPGSHRLKTALHIPEGKPDPELVDEPLLEAGDAVIFENRTWHAGGGNISDRIRKTVMLGYAYKWLSPKDYRVQSQALIDKVDDVGKQLLGGLRDPEGRFIPDNNAPISDWIRRSGVVYERIV